MRSNKYFQTEAADLIITKLTPLEPSISLVEMAFQCLLACSTEMQYSVGANFIAHKRNDVTINNNM